MFDLFKTKDQSKKNCELRLFLLLTAFERLLHKLEELEKNSLVTIDYDKKLHNELLATLYNYIEKSERTTYMDNKLVDMLMEPCIVLFDIYSKSKKLSVNS